MIHSNWHSILDGAERELALLRISQIGTAFFSCDTEQFLPKPCPSYATLRQKMASLANGWPAIAVFCHYHSKVLNDPKSDECCQYYLNKAIEEVKCAPLTPFFLEGFPGIHWAICHCKEDDYLIEEDAFLEESIRPLLLPYIMGNLQNMRAEYMAGLAGIGNYLLLIDKKHFKSHVKLFMSAMERYSVKDDCGIGFFSPPENLAFSTCRAAPEGLFDLGMAHGVAGIICFLAKCFSLSPEKADLKVLIERATSWLLLRRLEDGFLSQFPSWTGKGVPYRASRLAWCYGDLAVALAVWTAGACLGEEGWRREGLEIAQVAANRSKEQAGTEDACLCHGSAGLAHIFNRFYQATGNVVMKEAAQRWFRITIGDMAQPELSTTYESRYFVSEDGQALWPRNPGLLFGSAGVGLALLGAVSDEEPLWDACMLLDMPRMAP